MTVLWLICLALDRASTSTSEARKELSNWLDSPLVRGICSGIVSGLLLQPLDVMKTRLQEHRKGAYHEKAPNFVTLMRKHGIRAFWRGLGPSLCSKMAGHGSYFFFIDLFQTWITQLSQAHPQSSIWLLKHSDKNGHQQQELSPLGHWLLGVSVGISCCACNMPAMVVKTRLEAQAYSQLGLLDILRGLHQEGGLRSFYSGLTSAAGRDAMFSATFMVVFFNLQDRLPRLWPEQSRQTNFLSGILAGIIGTVASHPFDLVRSRMQLEPATAHLGMLAAFRAIMRAEGFRAFLQGSMPRITQSSLSCGISWTVYTELAALSKHLRQKTMAEELKLTSVNQGLA